jgi:periplasmic protein TonB
MIGVISCQSKKISLNTGVYVPLAPPPPPPIEEPKYDSDVVVKPDTPPMYKEGNVAFASFVANNLKQPPYAENSIDGTAWLSCIVELDGKLTDIRVKRGIGGGWNEEAIKVLEKTSGQWKAGVDKGKIVKALVFVPIKCVIK